MNKIGKIFNMMSVIRKYVPTVPIRQHPFFLATAIIQQQVFPELVFP
jgi:hypothetical protein